jgi:hypothetical protein
MFLRKHYYELLKLFFNEVQKGKHLSEMPDLVIQIDEIKNEISKVKKLLNINNDEAEST